ncbi:MAG: hypothetical protein K2X80_16220 [Pseudomonadaceae bacterium]|nr:hypothetical protein [Pseudomonadaceae bacterium]
MSANRRRPGLNARWLMALVLALLAGLAWLTAPYSPRQAEQLADNFIARLQAGDFVAAYQLTAHTPALGSSPAQLALLARTQLCAGAQRVSSFPPQSNGNRLRRWLQGREVEQAELHFEYTDQGACLLRVVLGRTASGQWQVQRFARHAG